MQGLFVEELGAGSHQPMPPREIDGVRRGVCSGGRDDRCGHGKGSGRLVPGTSQRRNIAVQQSIERTRGVHRRCVQHVGALAVVMTPPGVHQNRNGMTRDDDVIERLHFVGLQGLAVGVAAQHLRQRVERRHRLGQ
jgi:hypothetical protein